MSNYNHETGIAYGYISANVLHQDVVSALLYGDGCDTFTDHSWEDTKENAIAEWRAENPDSDLDDSGVWDEIEQDVADYYQPDESQTSGTYDGVSFATSWLGGALNFWIFHSPNVTDMACRASPCVPGAGILDDLDGDVTCYNVPDDWRDSDTI